MPSKFSFCLAITLCLGQCNPKPASTVASPAPPPNEELFEPFTVGELDKDGRLIFWSVDAFDHLEPFALREEYGVVLYNAGNEESPIPCYILAIQKTRTIVHTGEFATFQEALSKIPPGSSIGRYETCSMPRSYGLPASVVAEFEAALSAGGLKVKDEGVCYCPGPNY